MAGACAQAPRALVIDDDRAVGILIARVLKDSGFFVERCESGVAALVQVERGERFDFVVSDVEMPEMDGAAFYEAARAVWPEIEGKLVFISGAVRDDFPPRLDARCFCKPLGYDFFAHVRRVFEAWKHDCERGAHC